MILVAQKSNNFLFTVTAYEPLPSDCELKEKFCAGSITPIARHTPPAGMQIARIEKVGRTIAAVRVEQGTQRMHRGTRVRSEVSSLRPITGCNRDNR